MVSRVRSLGIRGIGGYEVSVECSTAQGLPEFNIVGLPDAAVKIFLTASAEKRAERRFKEYQEKGVDTTYETVLRDVEKRDYDDSHREIAPLKQAEDAVLLDTSEMTLEESEEAVKKIILAARDGQKE